VNPGRGGEIGNGRAGGRRRAGRSSIGVHALDCRPGPSIGGPTRGDRPHGPGTGDVRPVPGGSIGDTIDP
jgi:hypothetical protein